MRKGKVFFFEVYVGIKEGKVLFWKISGYYGNRLFKV